MTKTNTLANGSNSMHKFRLATVYFMQLAICFSITTAIAVAHDGDEKRPLEHSDYDRWNSIRGQNISNDGQWISYSVVPGKGDTTLKIRHMASDKEFSVVRGNGARFSFDSKTIVYTIAPDPELIKKLRKEKKKPEDFPKSKLEILNLASGKHTTIENVSSFRMPEKAAGWLAFKIDAGKKSETVKQGKSQVNETFEITPEGLVKPKPQTAPKTKEKKPQAKKEGSAETSEAKKQKPVEKESGKSEKPISDKDKKKKEKKNGQVLVLRNLEKHLEQRFPDVVNFRFSKYGQSLAFTTSADDAANDGVHVLDLKDSQAKQIISGLGNYGQPVFSDDAKQLAFLTDRDDYQTEKPSWSLYHWRSSQKQANKIADHENDAIVDGWWIASTAAPLFTEDGRRLLFNTAPMPEDRNQKDDDKEEEPKAKLDIWHWQDPFLQPQQLLQAARERNRSYRALYDIGKKKIIQIATKQIPNVSIDPRSKADVVVGISPDKYNKMRSWDVQGFSDSYLIDLKTGDSRLVLDKSRGTPSLSPGGKFITWWDGEQKAYFALPTSQAKPSDETPEPVNLTGDIGFPVHNELHDTPSLPRPYGTAGWLDKDQGLLVYDRWDIWQVDPAGKEKPICLTAGKGREQEIRFRYVRLDSEQRTLDLEQPMILSALVHDSKDSGYYRLTQAIDTDRDIELEPLIVLKENVSGLRKAKQSDDVMLARSTFQRTPDIWASNMQFKTMKRISRVNPQQHEYLWGSAELVRWNADDGQPLDGLLYKPENFDPQKKYPLMVYFYERNSDNLHRYYAPAAGRSIINFSFYVSRGYVIFVPDIPYKVGEPGPSAANAVLPGVKNLVSQGYIDEARIGMQGHSWGGYQTAYLVTATDMFACAESGAPVSNMTSAYGGIRWGTGMSRMFQYEKTQSRIGGTLWEARDKYIANSPLFFADKINTPLLILHNDKDTAVPWYQGIELFVALRRLEKPAWMLNYNGDPHWVMSDENRKDFAQRMQQFFDHYLKGEAMPVWMAEGIPAVDKGKKFGFEYVEAEPEPSQATETSGEQSNDNSRSNK